MNLLNKAKQAAVEALKQTTDVAKTTVNSTANQPEKVFNLLKDYLPRTISLECVRSSAQ